MITVYKNAPLIAPVYNPIYIEVGSDQTAQEGFSFVFDLYVNGVFINRERLQPRPGTTRAIYSPARVLESYVSYDLSQNTVGAIASTNCIDMYEVKVAEEYVAYWNYQTESVDTITSTSYTQLNAVSTAHPFVVNDEVLVVQNTGFVDPRVNGAHKVTAINTLSIVINVNYAGGSIAGKVCYADKRRTLFYKDPSVIFNPNLIQSEAGWAIPYGPDGCGVTLDWAGTTGIKFTVPDVTCGTAIQDLFNAYPFVGTIDYIVKYTISAVNNPSNETLTVTPWVGGTTGATVPISVGTFSQVVTGGGLSTFKLILDLSQADTAGFGSHSVTFSNIQLIDPSQLIEGYDFNGVVSYEEYPTWDDMQYVLNGITPGLFLTKSPRTLKTMLSERGSLGLLNVLDAQATVPGISFTLHIDVKDTAGAVVSYVYAVPVLDNSVLTNEKYVHLGAYPWNVNEFSTLNGDGNIIDTTTASYDFYIHAVLGPYDVRVSEIFTFQLYGNCSKYEPVRFMFLNSLGSFDYYTATLLSRTIINTQRDTYTRTLGNAYTVGDRGRTVLNVNSNETYLINTDWITEGTAKWLSYEMFNSTEVYVLNDDGSLTPIIIDNTSIEPKKRVNDSLINYQFNYSKAVPLNTQRN